MPASALFHMKLKNPDRSACSSNGINVDADISELPFVAPEMIFFFSRHFICAILLNIYRSPQTKAPPLYCLSHSLPLVSVVREMEASMSRSDANFVPNFHQSCHRLTWRNANESGFKPMYCAAYSKMIEIDSPTTENLGAAMLFASDYRQKALNPVK